MAKKFDVKVSKTEKVDALSVHFPDKCVNCGKPREMTLDFEVKQMLKNQTNPVSLPPLRVPYCLGHGEQLQQKRDRLESVFNRATGITWLIIIVPLFIVLYIPIYQWVISSTKFLELFGFLYPIMGFITTVIIITLLIGITLAVIVGLIAQGIWSLFLPKPESFRTWPSLGFIHLRFNNNAFADEFEHLNAGQLVNVT